MPRLALVFCRANPAGDNPATPLIEPPPLAESGDPVTENNPEPAVAPAPVSPSVQISGAIWRSKPGIVFLQTPIGPLSLSCLLYTSDAADERSSVDLGGRRIIKKKNKQICKDSSQMNKGNNRPDDTHV